MSPYGYILNPKPNTQFFSYHKRLALFHHCANHEEYWRQYWKDEQYTKSLIDMGSTGWLGEFEDIIERHVSRTLPVLEAGCGPGHLVAALDARGFEAIGVDYESHVVDYVKSYRPELDIRVGNILSLQFPDESFGCYLSIGVVEHFVGGPYQALKEARRLTAPEGVALISVPYLNRLRRSHFTMVTNFENQNDFRFHQYYFSEREFSNLLMEAGFQILTAYPYAVHAFLTREHKLFAQLWNSIIFRDRLKRSFRYFFRHAPLLVRTRYAHMIMMVCKPSSFTVRRYFTC